jgi:hypothetical protein
MVAYKAICMLNCIFVELKVFRVKSAFRKTVSKGQEGTVMNFWSNVMD